MKAVWCRSPLSERWLVLAALLSIPASAGAQTIRQDFSATDGTVTNTVRSGGTLYVAGNFNQVGPIVGTCASLDATTAALIATPGPDEMVRVVVPDGSGGWYIGGDFYYIGNEPHPFVAHILSDHTVSSWDPNVGGPVYAIALSGSTVYLGGTFYTIGGMNRFKIGAVSAITGLPTAFDPSADGNVLDLVVDGSTVYAAGAFLTIGGQLKTGLAALDATTGNNTGWGAELNGFVYKLAMGTGVLYAAGEFTMVGEAAHYLVARISLITGNSTTWEPNTNDFVYALAVSGSTVYVGGDFTAIGGQSRNRIAALDATTGNALVWNPNADSQVASIAVSGSTVYAGGSFVRIGGRTRPRIAKLDATTGAADAWDASANAGVVSIAVSGSTVYVGGVFTSIGGRGRRSIAAIDEATGAATAWDPSPNNTVLALAASGSTVYAGGYFTQIGGQARQFLAALDASGNATGWNPNPDLHVTDLAILGTNVIAAGPFGNIGGQARNYLAAVDVSTGNATAWNPNPNSTIDALSVSGSTVYVGGYFTQIVGEQRNYAAAIKASGVLTPWDPDPDGYVYTMATSGSTVYAGGFFSTIGGQSRTFCAALDATTGAASPWNPNADNIVLAIAVSGSTVYVGGTFEHIGGDLRYFLAALEATTGLALGWEPDPNSFVESLVLSPSTVYAGGYFDMVGEDDRGYLAALPLNATGWASDGMPVTTAPADQQKPTAVSDGEGGAIIGWEDNRPTVVGAASAAGAAAVVGTQRAYAVRVNDQGGQASGWSQIRLSTVESTQLGPKGVADGAGGAIIVWQDDRNGNQDLYAQHVMANGAFTPGWPPAGTPVCAASGAQQNHVVMADGAGGVIVAWEDLRVDLGGGPTTYAVRINGDGTVATGWATDGEAVTTLTGGQTEPEVVSDGAGGAVIAWRDARSDAGDIYAQRLTGTGDPAGGWPVDGRALCAAAGQQDGLALASDGAGGAIASWSDGRGANRDIYAQRVGSGGAPAWAANGVPVCGAADDQSGTQVVADGAGGVIVAWEDLRTSVDTNGDLYAQRLTSGGTLSGGWTTDGVALCQEIGDQQEVALVPDGSSGAVVTWTDERSGAADIYATAVLASGQIDSRWPVNGGRLCSATGVQHEPVIVPDGGGGALVAWTDGRGADDDIYVIQVLPPPPPDVAGAPVMWAAAASGLELLAPRPNPARGVSMIELVLARGDVVHAEVLDVTGRRVRELELPAQLPAGRYALRWDGRDGSGARVRSGVYFVQVRTAGVRRATRVVMLQ